MAVMEHDEALDQLLRHAGARLDLASIRALLPGVRAAPSGERDEDWLALVGGDLKGPVRARLLEMAEQETEPANEQPAERLARLRREMALREIDFYLIPRADEYQGEYVSSDAERLAYISGFTGSAGFAIIGRDEAAIFVDGRYTVQVRAEVDPAAFAYRHITKEPPEDYFAARIRPGMQVGADPRLFVVSQWRRFEKAVEPGTLVAIADNLVDCIWTNRPAAPIAPVIPLEQRFSGRSAAEKQAEIAGQLRETGQDALIVSSPDALNWLLNIRGGDVPRTPLGLGYGIVHGDGRVDLVMDARKLLPETRSHLGNRVAVHDPAGWPALFAALKGKRVLLDSASGSYWLDRELRRAGATVTIGEDPCALPKAIKNPVELAGARRSHERDGIALVRFLSWLDRSLAEGPVTEMQAAEQLLAFRRENEFFRDLSFDTIAGAGPHGAIVHYRATAQTNRALDQDSFFLLDSGAQYFDGTTDVTRTIAVGEVTAEMRRAFTLVLRGHIALACARFPQGTTGSQLDAIARYPLWQNGLDYDHGTGHGVGSYLSVHEGPQRISMVPNRVALRPGMILSNEPGYYKDGAYGIRIENLVAVTSETDGFLAFETLTAVPIDRRAIDVNLLSDHERSWVDRYHKRVHDLLAPHLDKESRRWLAGATAPL
ncbi:MAG TPA: aminopeptidase P family protein [Dongiaceae bacterium]|nr:aminopeptidase P family protein [Dongiaceae bacterium]